MTYGSILDVPKHIRIDNQGNSGKPKMYVPPNLQRFYVEFSDGDIGYLSVAEIADMACVVSEKIRSRKWVRGKKVFDDFTMYQEYIAKDMKIFAVFFTN